MSYRSRLYNHRNAQTPEGKSEQPFFSHRRAEKKPNRSPFFRGKRPAGAAGTPEGVIQRHSSPKDEEKLSTNDARIRHDKEIQEKPMDPVEKEKKEGAVQAKGVPEKDKMKGTLRRKEKPGAPVHPSIESRIAHASDGGSPLPQKVLKEMNASFHANFSHVRIHTGSEAVDLCKQLGAQAFTHGNHIYFNEGKFDPGSTAGKMLLAHELTHVLQQSSHTAPHHDAK